MQSPTLTSLDDALAAVLAQVQPHLTPGDWIKLVRSLGLPPVPGLVQ